MSVCTPEATLSLRDLEAFDPEPLLRGDHADYLCPFCHDDRRRDNLHRKLRLWAAGGWNCVRCGRHGFLEDRKQGHDDDPLRPGHKTSPQPVKREPSPAEIAEQETQRARLRRLWAATVSIADQSAVDGREYLWSREIPKAIAVESRVRWSHHWYGRPAVVFPMQNAEGRGVAAESRLIDGRDPKSLAAGPKSLGVFAAPADAIGADVLAVVEGPITALSLAACGLPALALCGHKWKPWLAKHLAGRVVFVAFDWYEPDAERMGDEACRALTTAGARVHRLSPPAGAGDFNDYLRVVHPGLMRTELERAVAEATS